MKKIALLLVVVLCCGLMAGCMGSVTTTPTDNSVKAYVELTVDDANTIILGVDKDQKVLTVSYGFAGENSSATTKPETLFNGLSLTGKSFEEAMDAIAGVLSSENKLTFKVKAAKDGKGDAVVSGSDTLIETLIEKINAAITKIGAKNVEVKKVDAEGKEDNLVTKEPAFETDSAASTGSEDTASEKPEVRTGDNVIIDDQW